MDRLRVAVLRVLDEENHQESDDRRSGINDELPGIRIMKGWAGNPPDNYDEQRKDEGPGAAQHVRSSPGEDAKGIAHDAKEIALRFLFLEFLLLRFLRHDILT